ncbi:hypothetical protein H0R92_05765 [Treponema sp. OMZ 840]|uniref:hypothetical protein n=1 Tax=Treponema sp. OMZ 840 TaxID=244313 RepID=UPI003D94D80F
MDILHFAGAVAAVSAALLIFYFFWKFFGKYFLFAEPAKKKHKGSHEKTPCPLCGSKLFAGENLVSRVYKTGTLTDLPCSIHGCPHCYPQPEAGIKRVCPVCHKEVPLSGHLDAHLFTRKTGKKHVHITGCTECHKKKPVL